MPKQPPPRSGDTAPPPGSGGTALPPGSGDTAEHGRRGGPAADAEILPLVPAGRRPPATARPLPDAMAVRRLAVPDCAPPFDDELAGSQPEPRAGAAPVPAEGRRAEPPAGAGPVPAHGQPGSPVTGRHAARSPADGWPSQFAQVLAETLAGSRPVRQITPWTTEQASRRIRQLGPMLGAGQQPRLRRVVACCPAAGVVEMTVIVGIGARVRAVAVRLEQDRPRTGAPPAAAPRWICTAVEAA